MAIFEGMVGLGIACLLTPVLAEYAKLRSKSEKGFVWIAVAGVFFLLAGATEASTALFGPTGYVSGLPLVPIFEIVAWILALIGTIFVGYEMILEK